MEWAAASACTITVLTVFWLPGAVVLAAARVRGLTLVALAPLVTAGTLGTAAVVSGQLGLRWGMTAAAASVLVVAGGLRALGPGDWTRPRLAPALAGGVLAGVLGQLVPLAVGMGRPGRLLAAHDALAHLSGVAHIRATGEATPWAFWELDPRWEGSAAPYPTVWHAVTALSPAWPDVPTLVNVASYAPLALAWTAGIAALARAVVPQRPRVHVLAALLSASAVSVPELLIARPEGMIPNAFATALVPAFLVAHVGRAPARPAHRVATTALAWVGLGLSHPNALLAGAVALLPWIVPRVVRRAREAFRHRRTAAVAVAVAAVGVAGATTALRLGWDLLHGVAQTPQGRSAPLDVAARWLSGNTTGAGAGAGFVVVAAAVWGAWLVRRLPARWLAGSFVLLTAFYVCAESSVPVLGTLDGPWFGETRRFAPVLALTLLPLAALALDSGPRWLVTTGRLRTALPHRRVARSLTAGVVALCATTGAMSIWVVARDGYTGQGPSGPSVVADDAELDLMRALPDLLEDGAVLGSPYSGAGHLFAVAGIDSVPRAAADPRPGSDLSYLAANVGRLGQDPNVCSALARLGVRYLYVDPVPWNAVAGQPDVREIPDSGVRVVATGGSATVVEVTICS